MDNDKQVKELSTQTTIGRFLNRPLTSDDRDRDNFDLDAEFAKTAKNKSLLIPLSVAVFLIVLAIGAWVASQFTEQASQRSSASIGSFEDLKLKEIFDTARRNKKDLEAIQAQMTELIQASDARVLAITQAGSSKADIASVNDASGTQAKTIQAQTKQQIAAEKGSLNTALAPLKAKAEEVQKKIDSYDDRIGQMNKKNQQVLDTQQRLFDLEKQKLTNQYEARIQSQTDEAVSTLARVKQERDDLVGALKAKQADDIRKLILKYNPVLTGDVAAQIAQFGTVPASYPAAVLPDRIDAANLISAELKKTLADRVARTQALVAKLNEIPFQNSVPGLINTIENAFADSLSSYDSYLAPLSASLTALDTIIAARDQTIADRDQTISDLQSALHEAQQKYNNYVADSTAAAAAEKTRTEALHARWTNAVDDFVLTIREDGVFVDMRDSSDWIVILKADRAKALKAALDAAAALPVVPLAPGKTAPPPLNLAVIRDGINGNELGTATVEVSATGWTAKLLKLNDPKKPFKAFDRITLALPVKK